MKRNMGSADRALRVLIAIVIAGIVFTKVITGIFAAILMVMAIVFLITGFIGLCPLYTLFGVTTCKHQAKQLNN